MICGKTHQDLRETVMKNTENRNNPKRRLDYFYNVILNGHSGTTS